MKLSGGDFLERMAPAFLWEVQPLTLNRNPVGLSAVVQTRYWPHLNLILVARTGEPFPVQSRPDNEAGRFQSGTAEVEMVPDSLENLTNVRDLLLDNGRNCADRVNLAWQQLQHVSAEELPPEWKQEWATLSERASRFAAESHTEPSVPGALGEAGEIGSILLCWEWLWRRGIIRTAETAPLAEQQMHRTASNQEMTRYRSPR